MSELNVKLDPTKWIWRNLCHYGTNFIACRRGRGTNLINSWEIVQEYEIGNRHWCSVAVQIVSEVEIYHSAGAKAKSVTNNLPILSMLDASVC